jgi:hypothetical protein
LRGYVSAVGGVGASSVTWVLGEHVVAGDNNLIRGLRSVDFEAAAVWLNGSPAIRIDAGGGLNAAVSVAVENGRITRIYGIANPHKLARLDGWPHSRGPDPQVASLPDLHAALEQCSSRWSGAPHEACVAPDAPSSVLPTPRRTRRIDSQMSSA